MAKTDVEPMEKFKDVSQDLFKALGDKALGSVSGRVNGLTDRLEDIGNGGPVGKAVKEGGKAAGEGGSPVAGALKGAVGGVKDKITGGGKSGGSPKATKATNIIEQIDVGVPISVAYNQWTEFGEFPSFMKKVENVDASDETTLTWKAQIVWSHRTWEASVLDQVPDERIVWRSKGEKGHVDGAVTFHELGPNLTRIILVLEYYPQGLFERTGNIWRAQARRAKAELQHFRRHVMTRTVLDPDSVEGWRGTIEDGEVVQSHEERLEEEEQEQSSEDEAGEEPEGEYEDEPEESEEEPEAEYEDEPAEDDPEAEYEDEAAEEGSEDDPEAEYEEVDEEPAEEEPEAEYEDEPAESEEEPAEEALEDEQPEEEADEEPAPKRSRRKR